MTAHRAAMMCVGVALLGGAGACAHDHEEEATVSDTARISEADFRAITVSDPLPVYPAASLQRASAGVAVADLTLGRDGRVETINLLEAPDDEIGKAVESAVRQWTFDASWMDISKSHSGGDLPAEFRDDQEKEEELHRRLVQEQLPVRTKVTFYFEASDGNGKIHSPADILLTRPGQPASSPAAMHDLDESGLARMRAAGPVTVLDIRPRARFNARHRDGAVNIPDDELEARAAVELTRSVPIVIDCGDESCAPAQDRLMTAGFSPVHVLLQDKRRVAEPSSRALPDVRP